MTHEQHTGTDELINEMLTRRAARGTSDGLRAGILGAVTAQLQHVSPLARVRHALAATRWTRVVVFAILATGLIGGLLLAGGRRSEPTPPTDRAVAPIPTIGDATVGPSPTRSPSPAPAPTPGVATLAPLPIPSGDAGITGSLRTTDFVKPFSYVVPYDVEGLRMAMDWSHVYSLVQGDDPRTTSAPDLGTNGVAVAHLDQPLVHPCPFVEGGPSRAHVRTDADGMVEDLRLNGIEVTRIGSAIVDGHEGTAFDLAASPCALADLHMVGGLSVGVTIPLDRPSRLINVNVGHTRLVILVWAETEAALQEWLKPAGRLIDSIRFLD